MDEPAEIEVLKINEHRGSGMAYASLCLAQGLAKRLAEINGGKCQDYLKTDGDTEHVRELILTKNKNK